MRKGKKRKAEGRFENKEAWKQGSVRYVYKPRDLSMELREVDQVEPSIEEVLTRHGHLVAAMPRVLITIMRQEGFEGVEVEVPSHS